MGKEEAVLPVQPDRRTTDHLVSIPTALQWRHPLPGQPSAMVFRAAQRDASGRAGAPALYTRLFVDHGDLPVISLWLPEEALFDADKGIYVVGNAVLDPVPEMMKQYVLDGRWWKYPGNFHYKGKEWERAGIMQFIGPDGEERFQAPVGVRINGEMTRGFPQHALRLLFNDPVPVPLFADGEGTGARALVLRAAGNDQPKAMMRDALMQELCVGMPFEVSRATTCVVYINGAYWGLHHLRQRVDAKEIARRYGVAPKEVTIMEIVMTQQVGDAVEAERFKDRVAMAKAWDGRDPAFLDSLDAFLDVDGFLRYMGAMMVLGARDWPANNAKYWRYTGPRGPGKPRDGRWYFIMTDADLGFGANAPASADVMAQIDKLRTPISDLLKALLRSPEMAARMDGIMRELVTGPLSEARCLEGIGRLEALMGPEMARHTARWRKPANEAAWRAEVQVLRDYASSRSGVVLERIGASQRP